MKTLTSLFVCLFVGILFFSCSIDGGSKLLPESDEPANLELVVRATFNGSPLVMLEEQTLDDSTKLIVSRLSMFLNDLSLMNAGAATQIDDIRMVNLTETHSTLAGAQIGWKYTFNNIEPATYNALRFGFGVLPADNDKQPMDYPVGNPLNDGGEYWQGWQSYVFSKMEGRVDADGAQAGFELDMSLHCGGNELYQEVTLDKEINLQGGETTQLVLEIDAKDILSPADNALFYDLRARSQLHSTAHKPEMTRVTTNWINALNLQ